MFKREEDNSVVEKPCHDRFLIDTGKISTERTWKWLRGEHLEKEIEAIVYAPQEQAVRVNSMVILSVVSLC